MRNMAFALLVAVGLLLPSYGAQQPAAPSHTGADAPTATAHGTGDTAVVDLAAGTITSPDLPAFTNVM